MPGQSHAANLALSPVYRLYSAKWEQTVVDPLREMSALLIRANLKDFDNDSFLEYPDGHGGYLKIALDFIVNSDNAYKVQAAHKIVDTLRLYGINIIVRELPWDGFIAALQTGAFDMYYGEIVLGADFNLSPLLAPDSYINYGRTGHEIYEPLINNFLSARLENEERAAAEILCEEVKLNAPFVPILYKKYAVYTPIGAIISATPSQSGVFSGFASWKTDLTMLP
jgi:peptide/nickel transport system substrate-binding protein